MPLPPLRLGGRRDQGPGRSDRVATARAHRGQLAVLRLPLDEPVVPDAGDEPDRRPRSVDRDDDDVATPSGLQPAPIGQTDDAGPPVTSRTASGNPQVPRSTSVTTAPRSVDGM